MSTVSILSHMAVILKIPYPLHCFFLVNFSLPYKNLSYREDAELPNVKKKEIEMGMILVSWMLILALKELSLGTQSSISYS